MHGAGAEAIVRRGGQVEETPTPAARGRGVDWLLLAIRPPPLSSSDLDPLRDLPLDANLEA